jgi:hypothetical protein
MAIRQPTPCVRNPKLGHIDLTVVREHLLDFYARETSLDQLCDEFMRGAMCR